MINSLPSFSWLKAALWIGLVTIFSLAIVLWMNTPDLFEYFNMAFCAH